MKAIRRMTTYLASQRRFGVRNERLITVGLSKAGSSKAGLISRSCPQHPGVWIACVLLIGLLGLVAYSPDTRAQKTAATETTGTTQKTLDQGVKSPETPVENAATSQADRLAQIAEQLKRRRAELTKLQQEIAGLPKGADSPELKSDEAELNASIRRLNIAFEQIATNGIESATPSDTSQKPYNWQDELVSVVKPMLSGLKELTEKPRRIEELRSKIEALNESVQVADKALSALNRFPDNALSDSVAENIKGLRQSWQNRRTDALSDMETARVQLKTLDSQEYSYTDTLLNPLRDFVLGRGLTLLIALGVSLGLWLGLRLVFDPLLRRLSATADRKSRRSRQRVVSYLYRAFSAVIIAIGVLVVFYLRSDTLLLALAIVSLGFIAVGLRHLAPKYMRELRLLLDIGAVREGERIIYGSLPMQVRSIGTFVILRNPELEGIVRLPLPDLTTMVSRPVGEEQWFPSRKNDVVLLPDDSLATVISQTIDVVTLRIGPSHILHPTVDFAKLPMKNLSRDGFTAVTTFGIDYEHQAIALDEVKPKMEAAVTEHLQQSTVADSLESVTVDFKVAAANSLDYIIFVRMKGEAAASYFAIGRMVQTALVGLCNRENWGIPFAQLTIHRKNEAATQT
ncbi:MAG: hypothetical protein WBD13_18850 [Burkholderiaceae bacterium]